MRLCGRSEAPQADASQDGHPAGVADRRREVLVAVAVEVAGRDPGG
jgi:hypothetical protein